MSWTLQRALPHCRGSLQGSPAAQPTLVQYQIFGPNIFYPLIISPSLPRRLFSHCPILFLVGIFTIICFVFLVPKDTFCDTWWKYASPPWLLIESIVPGYFPNFTWLLSVGPQWDNSSPSDLIWLSPAITQRRVEPIQPAFCQGDTNLKTIWTLSRVTAWQCHDSCVTCDGGCPGPVTLMFPDNLQRCFANNASYEEKMHSMITERAFIEDCLVTWPSSRIVASLP